MVIKILQTKVADYSRGNKRFLVSDLTNLNKINYKNITLLSRFTSEQGKIIPRRISGTSAKTQHRITREIKRARILALLPFTRATKFNISTTNTTFSSYKSRSFSHRNSFSQKDSFVQRKDRNQETSNKSEDAS